VGDVVELFFFPLWFIINVVWRIGRSSCVLDF
jgi:hypothetical protein